VDRYNGPGFIGAGVGITPLMNMLRTMADRGDPRPCYLFFGNREWEGAAFREEIEELKGRLDLEVVHVLSRPRDGREKKAVSEQRCLRGTCPSDTRAFNTSSAAPIL
jgi:ferredoxin-NADP reductase